MSGTQCDWPDCEQPVALRAYAAYNVDHGENIHPRHARYPMPMIRSCPDHLGVLCLQDTLGTASTRQWLIVAPVLSTEATS